jgi:hypothetical protein
MLTLLLTGPVVVRAEGICEQEGAAVPQEGETYASLYLARVFNCVGTERDDAPLTQSVLKRLGAETDAIRRVIGALDVITDALNANPETLNPSDLREVAQREIAAARVGAKARLADGTDAVAPTRWAWTAGQGLTAVPGIELRDRVRDACGRAGAPELCSSERAYAIHWLRIAALVRVTLSLYSDAYVEAKIVELERRVKMWKAYREEALPQFWWEYGLNSWRMGKQDQRVVDGQANNPEGYETVPDSQIIFLHPGAALQWRDVKAGTSEEEVKPAIYVELLGLNRWSWNESTGEMRGGRGISLMMTYAERDGSQDVGYGLLFHSRTTKQFKLGIARSDGEMMYMLNVDLAEYFKERMDYWQKVETKIRGIRDKITEALN